MSDSKKCSKCGEEKPATTEYFRFVRNRGNLESQCINCIRERDRSYRAANRERRREASIEWHDANKEYAAKRKKEYRAANKDRRDEYQRVYREKNRERDKDRKAEKMRAYSRVNPEVMRANERRRRARTLNAPGTHKGEDVIAQHKAQNGLCYYCKSKLGDKYHVDHVIPLSRGGSNGPENLVIACPFCNRSKHDKLPHEWPQGGRLL